MTMSDDLVKRLRKIDSNQVGWGYAGMAANRIEALTTERDALAEKLEKAVEALREAENAPEPDHHVPQFRHVMDVIGATLALIPDAGAALDRALAAERERCAKVAEAYVDGEYSYGPDFDAGWEAAAFAIAAAIRHGSASFAQK